MVLFLFSFSFTSQKIMASWLTPFLPCSVYREATAQAPLPAIRPGVALSSTAKRRASAGVGAAPTPRGSGCLWGRAGAPHVTPSAPSTPSRQWKKSSTHRPPPLPPPSISLAAAAPRPPPAAAGPAERVVTMTTRAATASATRRWCSPPLPLGRRRLVPDRRPAATSTMHPRPAPHAAPARRLAPAPGAGDRAGQKSRGSETDSKAKLRLSDTSKRSEGRSCACQN